MIVQNKTFDEERAFYESNGLTVENCRFDGHADGESAFKESKNINVKKSYFNLRYPFWHDNHLVISNSEMTDKCRAALWYTRNATITDTKMHGVKAVRECSDIKISNCDIVSAEFGWSVDVIEILNSSVESEYFMMRSKNLKFKNVSLKGKYSFQYIEDSVIEDCNFDTKDAFWHARNVIVRNSVINGAYLAWYCDNVTFDNCTISGTQPLCYCKNLRLVNCKMLDADLSFEKSDVEATVTTPVISIKNPLSGTITVPEVKEIIITDPNSKGNIVQTAI